MITVLYAASALAAIFLIAFGMLGDTLGYRAVRRWWYLAATALAIGAWLAGAWLR